MGTRGHRLPADAALAVPVQVVLALLGEELDGAAIAFPVAATQRVEQRVVAQLGVEAGRLPRQLRRRVGVGAGDQRVVVEPGDAPVHRRIGGETGLHGEDVGREVGIALAHRVEPRLGAEDREPRGPDVGRDQVAAGVHLKHDLQQVAAVEAQDRATVGADVADLLQFRLQPRGGLERRREDDVVHLPGALVLLVDVADLAADQEAHGPAARRRHLVGQARRVFRLEPEQPGFRRLKLLAQLRQPAGMGDVAGGHHLHPLELRPLPQVLQGQVAAGGAGVVRVEMDVGDQLHVVGGTYYGRS